ncbi:hypothetical protein ACLKA6_004880 [Drosophila palustris]
MFARQQTTAVNSQLGGGYCGVGAEGRGKVGCGFASWGLWRINVNNIIINRQTDGGGNLLTATVAVAVADAVDVDVAAVHQSMAELCADAEQGAPPIGSWKQQQL